MIIAQSSTNNTRPSAESTSRSLTSLSHHNRQAPLISTPTNALAVPKPIHSPILQSMRLIRTAQAPPEAGGGVTLSRESSLESDESTTPHIGTSSRNLEHPR